MSLSISRVPDCPPCLFLLKLNHTKEMLTESLHAQVPCAKS